MPRQVTFCLCPGFPLFSIASALDVLRHANRFSGKDSYRWNLVSDNDAAVADGNGLELPASCNRGFSPGSAGRPGPAAR